MKSEDPSPSFNYKRENFYFYVIGFLPKTSFGRKRTMFLKKKKA